MNLESQSKSLPDLPGKESHVLCLYSALIRGSLGFGVVSVAGFAVWALGGKWVSPHFGEGGLYAGCALAFVGLSGLMLHPLVRGPSSLLRFYKIFVPAFCAYAFVWSAAWFAFGFGIGEWLGSLLGSIGLVLMIGRGFRNYRPVARASAVMFALHSAGYFLGGLLMRFLVNSGIDGALGMNIGLAAKLSWGFVYGLGTGAGLGYAFFAFQDKATRPPLLARADKISRGE